LSHLSSHPKGTLVGALSVGAFETVARAGRLFQFGGRTPQQLGASISQSDCS